MIQATSSRGVISGNTLNTSPFGGNCNNTDFLVHISGTGSGWTEIAKFGNLDTDGTWKLYIENNVDNYGSEGVSNNDGSRAVIRFNTFRNGGIDHHGANTQAFGTRYTEVYKNNFVWDNRTWDTCTDSNRQNGSAGIGSGGGTSIFVANAMDTLDVIPSPGWGTKYSIALLEERPWRLSDGSGWKCWGTAMQPSLYAGFPIPYQNGWGYISGGTQAGNAPVYMDRQPWYFAGNTGSGITQVGSVVDPKIENYSSNECGSTQDVTDFLHADQEYYKQVPLGSFDGTTGASQGMRSERPSNCTTGVVFWSTDQGSWNNSGSGGQGVLDKCTSTNTWTDAWYVPFDYPHPLAITGPYISTLTPSSGNQGATSLSVAVVGSDTNFVNATTVCDFGSNITINSCTVSSATALTANITISSSAALGARSATFTTGGEVATKSNGFTVTSIGTISSLTPAAGLQGDTSLSIAVVGSNTNFVNGTTVCNFGSNITINSCTVASSTTLTANITIAGGATTGLRNATFTTGVEVATIVNGFTVSAVSTPTIFNPRMLRN
jgi:hypothetical protein